MIELSSLFTWQNLLLAFAGSFVGLLVGAMPGLGTAMAIVLLMPFSYSMKAMSAIVLLLCAYQSAEYGGSISSITLGVPGTPSASATVLDGYAMAKNGRPGRAIAYSLFASTTGGFIGALALMFLTKPLANFSLRFNSPDFCMLALLALFGIVTISSKEVLKGLVSVCIGLMLSTIGTDTVTGASRFTLGLPNLTDGIYTVAVAVGVFAFPEMLGIISDALHKRYVTDMKDLKSDLKPKDYAKMAKPIAIGSVTGIGIGVFPGIGGAVAAWMSYMMARKASRHPETFGTGEPEGISAPEAANNACVSGSLIPLLALGIPGSTSMAILATAFMIHGVKVGPNLFTTDPALLNGIYIAFFFAVIIMFVLGKLMTPFFASILAVPGSALVPVILTFVLIGVYAGKKVFLHLWVALIIGVVGYFLKRKKYPLAPIVVAFVLRQTVEVNFRRSLELSGGSLSIFVKSGYSKVIFVLVVIVAFFPLIKKLFKMLTKNRRTYLNDIPEDDN